MKAHNQPGLNFNRMRPHILGAAIFFALISFHAKAQNSQDDSKEVIMYDPLFWKDELALRNNQSRKIEQINSEFYQSLRDMKHEQVSREENNIRLEQGLHERSQKIFDTLLPKQRRKLEKIMDKTAPVSAP